jgi:hypothetical protein
MRVCHETKDRHVCVCLSTVDRNVGEASCLAYILALFGCGLQPTM